MPVHWPRRSHDDAADVSRTGAPGDEAAAPVTIEDPAVEPDHDQRTATEPEQVALDVRTLAPASAVNEDLPPGQAAPGASGAAVPEAEGRHADPVAWERPADPTARENQTVTGEWSEGEVFRTGRPATVFPEPLVLYGQPTLRSDPRGLPSIEPTVPDTVLDGADLDKLSIRAASLRGDDHRYMARPRQDSMGMWQVTGATATAFLICAADGVGSEPLSHLGAATACQLLREEIPERLDALLDPQRDAEVPSLCRAMAERIGLRLTDRARWLDATPRTLSTTLVGALLDARPADPARRRCVVFAVGDSTAFLLRDLAFDPCLPEEVDGLIADPSTAALPGHIGQVGIQILTLQPTDVLMICTDGLSGPMRNATVRDQLAEWWSSPAIPSMPEFGWQLSFRAKSFGDDRTAICAWGR
jgi:serine/threonine protein phosphatase PrpC